MQGGPGMENLFQREWYGWYWFKLMIHDWKFLVAVAVVIVFIYCVTRITRR